jgi:hypothetical protein
MTTYNEYLTEEAQRQSNNGPFNIYKVRRPAEGEEVIGHTNFGECTARKTLTEQCVADGEERGE